VLAHQPAIGQSNGLEGLTVREIHIEGLHRTSRQLVIDQLQSAVGEPYSEKNRRLDVEYLDRLWIFSSIEVAAERINDGVLLTVRLRETFPFSVYVSATTTQENGLSLGPGAGAINLGGKAIKASAAVEFGAATNFFFDTRTPRLTGNPWWLEAGLAHATRDNTIHNFREKTWTTGNLVGYQFNPHIWLTGGFQLIALSSDQPGITLNPSGHDVVPSLSLGLRFDTRDRWSNPRAGWFLGADLTRSGLFGGDGAWWTTQFEARRYQPLAGRHILAGFSYLALQSGEPGINLPVWMVYGIGGANSVRGWQAGARQGKNQWLNTVEYRYQLVKPRPIRFFKYALYWGLHLALYGDLGTAWTPSADFSRNFIGGAGYGVRLVIPYVGVFRFDRAFGNGLRPAYGIGEPAEAWRDRVR